MKRAIIAGGAFAIVLLVLALALRRRTLDQNADPAAATSSANSPSSTPQAADTDPGAETHQGFLYGRITTLTGATYEGRLRCRRG